MAVRVKANNEGWRRMRVTVFRKMPELHLRLVKVDFGTVGFAMANWRVGNGKVGDANG
jgi:hypothetical protein